MKHLVITRFNVPLGWTDMDETWTVERIRLMSTYTQPSLEAQTCQAFTWVVLMDPDREDLRDQMKHEFPSAVLAFERWQVTVARLAPPGTDLLTTRVDSDDMLGPDYVRRAQELSKTGSVFNFKLGHKIDTGGVQAYESELINSPFQSYREVASDKTKTIYGLGNHSHVHKKFPTIQEETYRGWCEVIHDGNIYNHIRKEDRPTGVQSWVTVYL